MKRFFPLALGLRFLTVAPWLSAAERPPNVVFIMADDFGWNELGCYGSSKIKTPRIDHLASEGVRFTNAYEGGIRVPLLVRWQGKIAAGTRSDFRTWLEDWLPTLVDLGDADLEVR